MSNDRRTAMLEFIRRNLAEDEEQVRSADQPLISSGLVDSFALVELSLFIEEEFGVVIPDPEMTVANFDTVELGVATIERIAGE